MANQGPSDADNLVVDDPVPAAVTAGTPSADLGGDCSSSAGNTIHCSLSTRLAPGATWTLSLPYSVGSSVVAQTVTNTATAASDENPGGVPASDATTVTASADLGVSIDDGVASVTAGDGLTYTYTITVTNFGPSDATAVDLADSWPIGFSRGALPVGCADAGPGPDFSCALGTIAAGGSASRTITYTVPASTTASPQVDSVTVSSLTADPAAGNNTATDGNTVLSASPTPVPTSTPPPPPRGSPGSGVLPDTAHAPRPSSVIPGLATVIVALVAVVVLFGLAMGKARAKRPKA